MIFNKNECNYLDLTRFIGISLVVLGHLPLNSNSGIVTPMIFSFHMPLFFVISGMLHKDQVISIKNIKNLAYSLLLPYLIYNILAILVNIILNGISGLKLETIYNLLLGIEYPSLPTWFLLSLFLVKLSSFFIKNIKLLVTLSLVAILYLYLSRKLNIYVPNYFTWQSALFSYPFWVVGIILNKYGEYIPKFIKIIIILFAIPISYLSVTNYSSISLTTVTFGNIFANIPTAIWCSLALIFLCQFIARFVQCSFIKDISRGTMIIMCTHMIFIFNFTNYWEEQSLLIALIKTTLIILVYYPIIKLTYNRIPLLYGKHNKKKS